MPREDIVVLAVDDDKINLMLLKSVLKKTEIVKETITASNGQEALDILKNRSDIDLILLDIIMPIMGGIEMLQIARADASIRQVPIIVLTTDETKKEEALEYGANEFLMKPIRKDDLAQKIKNVIV
jgi:putative two-component system response regulator